MSHFDVVDRLAETWIAAGQESEIPDMLSEYLRRDLINQAVGNTDNHGGNLSILRGKERVSFAPIYDLAPMVMDIEGVVRITRWPTNIERLGSVDWEAVCDRFAHRADPQWLFHQPGESTVQQIAAVLNLPLAYFYCEDDETAHLLQCFHCLKKDDRKQVVDLAENLAFNH